MISAMKTSAFDTFCRALVLGAVFGALGWGAVRYTNLPQMALQKIVALSREVQGKNGSENYLQDVPIISSTSPAPISLSEPLLPGQHAHTDLQHIPTVTPGILQQQQPHSAQQAAYLEPTVPSPSTHQPPQLSQTINNRTAIEQRLCELGAVYSLLEMWGHETVQYRFHCCVSIANNRQVTRSFEANGSSPEDAMRQVLKEVEGFQSTSSLQGPDVH